MTREKNVIVKGVKKMKKLLNAVQVTTLIYILTLAGKSDCNLVTFKDLVIKLCVAVLILFVAQALKKSAAPASTCGQAQYN